MKEIRADASLIACCGLYCGSCDKYLQERCPGCAGNEKATWCRHRTCCAEHAFRTCAECTEHPDAATCSHFRHPLARVLAFFYNSNRPACVREIRRLGPEGFAARMAGERIITLPRGT